MAMKLAELASALSCVIAEEGCDRSTADIEITAVRGIENAGPGDITFLSNPKYASKLRSTQASAVIAAQPVSGIPTLLSSNPYLDFARGLALFYQPPRAAPGVHP